MHFQRGLVLGVCLTCLGPTCLTGCGSNVFGYKVGCETAAIAPPPHGREVMRIQRIRDSVQCILQHDTLYFPVAKTLVNVHPGVQEKPMLLVAKSDDGTDTWYVLYVSTVEQQKRYRQRLHLPVLPNHRYSNH